MFSVIDCGRFKLDLSAPRIMAIINVTPDSFSAPGHMTVDAALRAAELAVEEGADMLDIGGESSRPGALPVSEQEELDRVVPVVEALASFGLPLSVDTVKPGVMKAVISAGADMINDIAGFRAEGALDAVAEASVALCVMHMKGQPGTMQLAPEYSEVCQEVSEFLSGRVGVLEAAGVARQRIVLDPGFGFGKSLEHNLAMLRDLEAFLALGFPLLVGMSRKTMLGQITGRDVSGRAIAGAVAAFAAVERGARIVRTHDVAQTRDALRVWGALEAAA
ncbi:dihydropteroate synthase family protein [Zoogloea sp.]|uniref:dihydropteroate synthase n=1 Tax=Zoogloea sp. TaxID=49181 RepID=UPI0014157A48|nr:MAG: dihydropteroate synthase [Zoogloea sp.]